jgi:hypothetical protein
MLIRGPAGQCVFGTACSHVRWQLPPMTGRECRGPAAFRRIWGGQPPILPRTKLAAAFWYRLR